MNGVVLHLSCESANEDGTEEDRVAAEERAVALLVARTGRMLVVLYVLVDSGPKRCHRILLLVDR